MRHFSRNVMYYYTWKILAYNDLPQIWPVTPEHLANTLSTICLQLYVSFYISVFLLKLFLILAFLTTLNKLIISYLYLPFIYSPIIILCDVSYFFHLKVKPVTLLFSFFFPLILLLFKYSSLPFPPTAA